MMARKLVSAMARFERCGLSAGLVAWTWQTLLNCEAPALTLAMSLAFAGWVAALYLADRAWDVRRSGGKWPRCELAGSLVCAVLASGVGLVPWWNAAGGAIGGLALCVVGYYAARAMWPAWQQGRAFVVGGVFALGVHLPSLSQTPASPVALTLLFTANVLLCTGGRLGLVRACLAGAAVLAAWSGVTVAGPIWLAAALLGVLRLPNVARPAAADAILWASAMLGLVATASARG